ncbi:nitroreductase family protein [Klebsiella quasipneumoniae subsp. quasipneumoniae]|uniref:nitroreductase family protein n=1 Tax=Klebsiella quasipneumoniae TaxID=1463165 RepID=UPI00217E7475|nr:nitroreductase family protein [Klebsiella quasipneumoniae]MCS5747594.1 nitroreductase family protein [Klebsiella quasipneumoniae subsp. quasipneumoniae]
MKQFINKILGKKLTGKLRLVKESCNTKIVYTCSKTRFLSSLYYFVFNSSFKRENQAVLHGKHLYKESLTKVGRSSALLRRNVHRLEKGLIMRPRREIFAKDYILETVEQFERCVALNTIERNEMDWAYDVITKYFDSITINGEKNVVKANDIFSKASSIYLEKNNCQSKDFKFIPYSRESSLQSNISYEELKKLFLQRRSVRWFDQTKTVDAQSLMDAIELASLAPSACNRQPFKFYFTVDQTKAREIAKIPMGTVGFADNIVALIVIVGDLSYYPYERDRHVIYIDASLAAMQLMLALETLGLSSCPVNWPDIESFEVKMEKKLGLTKNLRPIILLPVGYADPTGLIPSSSKKSSSELAVQI